MKMLTSSRDLHQKNFNKMIKSQGLSPIHYDSRYPTLVGDHLLKHNFPKIIYNLPNFILYPTLMLAVKFFGVVQRVSWLKLFGARMGFLSINNR